MNRQELLELKSKLIEAIRTLNIDVLKALETKKANKLTIWSEGSYELILGKIG